MPQPHRIHVEHVCPIETGRVELPSTLHTRIGSVQWLYSIPLGTRNCVHRGMCHRPSQSVIVIGHPEPASLLTVEGANAYPHNRPCINTHDGARLLVLVDNVAY